MALSRRSTSQARDELMMHDEAVLALGFSRDSELLASGSQDGHIKVWRLRTGQCVRRFAKAHSQGVTAVAFARDSMSIASASFDTTVRVRSRRSDILDAFLTWRFPRVAGARARAEIWEAAEGDARAHIVRQHGVLRA